MHKRDGQMVVESREPTFFVPMTGQAESLAQRDRRAEPVTPLAQRRFRNHARADKPDGWYYLRQATIVDGGRPQGKRAILFRNRVEGRNAQALQAIGVDGRRASEIVVDLWVKAHKVAPAKGQAQGAVLVVNFFDDQRAPIGQQSVGPWSGTFDWQRSRRATQGAAQGQLGHRRRGHAGRHRRADVRRDQHQGRRRAHGETLAPCEAASNWISGRERSTVCGLTAPRAICFTRAALRSR